VAFLDVFTTSFFSADGDLKVSEPDLSRRVM